MGTGINFVCGKCNEKESLCLGCGFNSFMNGIQNVIYVCKRCGYWINKEEKFKQSLEEAEQELKEQILYGKAAAVGNKATKIEMCPACKIRMKKYEDYYNGKGEPKIPKIICKKCGGELKEESMFCWD